MLKQNTGFYCVSENENKILEFWCKTYLDSLRSCDLLYRLEFNTWDNLVNNFYNKTGTNNNEED